MTKYRNEGLKQTFALVPVEPTQQMIDSVAGHFPHLHVPIAVDAYDTMLSAAPSPWRPISECPTDQCVDVAVLSITKHGFSVQYNRSDSASVFAGDYWMLASDFPLPVEGE